MSALDNGLGYKVTETCGCGAGITVDRESALAGDRQEVERVVADWRANHRHTEPSTPHPMDGRRPPNAPRPTGRVVTDAEGASVTMPGPTGGGNG